MHPTYQATNTDLYQLTMAAGYFENNSNHMSTFELFVRKLPANRSYLVAAGIEQCLQYLENLKFYPEEIKYLKSLPQFKSVSKEFFKYLESFKFSGDVYALEEGTIFFPNEPAIRVTAPAIEAQIVETYLLSMFNYQTLIASKAARIFTSAPDCKIIDFGTRRAHSPEAGVLAARAAYIGGCCGTSNVLAASKFDIPAYGTMAHSWIMSFESEKESFEAYNKVFPGSVVLLIDTYDTIEAAKMVAKLPFKVSGVRLDSGNFELLSKEVRKILDKEGKNDIKILVSGDMNEYKIKDLLASNSPIDYFGVGTELATSKDAPALSGVYKLVEQDINGLISYKAKFSKDKKSYPSKKQVYRFYDNNGLFSHDIISPEGELDNTHSDKLLKPAIKGGTIVKDFKTDIKSTQNNCLNSLEKLPSKYKVLENAPLYEVKISESLEKLADNVMKSIFTQV
ncbi:MAG: nicotinate phosphoribosyltransferase [Cyanobacteriota bacterium]